MKRLFQMKKTLFVMLSILLTSGLFAQIRTQEVEYRDGDTVLQGYLAYDTKFKGKRPGILVVHEWWGLNGYAKRRAEELAKLGYVAFAADMYGKGVLAKDYKEAETLSGTYKKDRPLMRRRAAAALDALKKDPHVNPEKIAAMGYCFGGGVALELWRSRSDLKGVVSFHGNLDTPDPAQAGKVEGNVLVFQGGDDKYTLDQLAPFEDEMRKAGIDWQVVEYGGAVHGFTNPDNGSDPSKGVAYNRKADLRSWATMREFFKEIFQQ